MSGGRGVIIRVLRVPPGVSAVVVVPYFTKADELDFVAQSEFQIEEGGRLIWDGAAFIPGVHRSWLTATKCPHKVLPLAAGQGESPERMQKVSREDFEGV